MPPTASLHKFVQGGGGLIGVKQNCVLTNFRVLEHRLVDSQGKAYPTNTFVGFDIDVEDEGVPDDRRHSEQFLQVGRLPLWRVQQIGETPDDNALKYPGGILPSMDGENPATAGPFVILDGEKGIFSGSEWAIFETELQGLAKQAGVDEQYFNGLDSKGVAALNGIRVFLDTKAKPKSKKKAQEEELSGKKSQERTVIVAAKVNQWPWEASGSKPAAAASAASSSTAKQPAPAASQPTPAPAPAAVSSDNKQLAVQWVQKVGGAAPNNTVAVKDLVTSVFKMMNAEGADGATKAKVMTLINNRENVLAWAAEGHFIHDPATDSIMVFG